MSQSEFELSADEESIIEEETRLLCAVRDSVEKATGPRNDEPGRREMSSLRGDLGEADIDDRAAVAAEAQRARATTRIRGDAKLPDLQLPYFAHMQLETERGLRDVLLGQHSFVDTRSHFAIVDWREAPLAQIFFQYAEGDDYEQDLPGRSVEGVLLKRRLLAFEEGELVHIQTAENSLRRRGDGEWARDPTGRHPTLAGAEGGGLPKRTIGTGRSGEKMPVISSLLDAQQYRALTHEAERPLLILGGAGCGKTTVALHRLAHLTHQDPDRHAPGNLMVIVPEEGLVRLARSLLAELGMKRVPVTTVDGWFAERAADLFPELPTRLAVSTPPSVIGLKRHPALCANLPALAEEAGRSCAAKIDRTLMSEARFGELYRGCEAETPLQRLEDAFEQIKHDMSDAESRKASLVFAHEKELFLSPLGDRERLLGDRELLERVLRDARGELPKSTIDRFLLHSRLQYSLTAEEQFEHIPVARRTAVDGRKLDEGTSTEDAATIDVEDFALLLELDRLKTGRPLSAHSAVKPYTHLVLDEAQELSRVELLVLGRAVTEHGSVTVAGDPAQQIGTGTHFESWEAVMAALGKGRAAPVTLETSYRCTRPIVEFGHAVLGPLAPTQAPTATKGGAPISRSLFSSEMHASIVVAETLSDLLTREGSAQVAIIAREDQTAERLHASLRHQLPVRLVLDGSFSFKPGVDITSVPHVKGLEFDYVVIPDASDRTYPDDPASRRMLHVAATRAIHQLWILSQNDWSRLLPDEAK